MLQWAMLTVYRRHLKACPYRSRKHRRCKCPLWVAGTLAGEPVKKSLDVTSWEAAQDKVRLWESQGRMEDRSEVTITLRDAVQKFIDELQDFLDLKAKKGCDLSWDLKQIFELAECRRQPDRLPQ